MLLNAAKCSRMLLYAFRSRVASHLSSSTLSQFCFFRFILTGGGTLFPYAEEKKEPAGGRRALAVRVDVPTIDLPRWILK